MGASVGGSKSGSHEATNQNTAQYGTQTPNNLAYLQGGWNNALATENNANSNGLLETLGRQGAQDALDARGQSLTLANQGDQTATAFDTGSYASNPADAYLTPSANGSYLSSGNPEFKGMVGRIADALEPQIDGSFGAAGRYGSGANANAFASALTNESGNLAYQNYNDERARQLQAAQDIASNYTAGRQQQLQGLALTPQTEQALYAPAAAETEASQAPLLAYSSEVAAGNGGGSFSQTGNNNVTSNGTKYNVQASASYGAPGGGGTPMPS